MTDDLATADGSVDDVGAEFAAAAARADELAQRVDAVYYEVGRKGTSRARALEKAEARLGEAMRLVETALRAGVPLNLTEVARRAGVAKQTVYNHLPPELVAGRGELADREREETPT